MSKFKAINISNVDGSSPPRFSQQDKMLLDSRTMMRSKAFEGEDNPFTKYSVYYSGTLLYNVHLLALYIVQVFSEHETCLTKSSNNITDSFHLAFMLGFVVLLLDFINSGILIIYFRFRVQ